MDKIVQIYSDLKHRTFPRSFERLALDGGKELVGVEIGVYKGAHAESLLKNLDIKHLYLVDSYSLYETYEDGIRHYGIDQDDLEKAKLECEARLAPYKDKITWVLKRSELAFANIPNDLDFVYIDGNHAEEFVKQDIENYFPKVKAGGIIGGHDFYNGYCREHDGVVNAVIKFAVQNNLQLQTELPDWWVKK